RARRLVQLHAELGGALEDVEELAEGQVQQRPDHRDRVQDREESIIASPQPQRRRGEREPGDRNREQQDQGKKIRRQLLQRKRAEIARPPPERQRDSTHNERRREIEPVKEDPRNHGSNAERSGGEPEEIRDVSQLVVRSGSEMNPAEYQRKGDGYGAYAPPE